MAPSAKSRMIARRRAEHAARGVYECMGACKQVHPLSEGIVVTWGNNVLLAICPACFPDAPIKIGKCAKGIEVGFLNVADKPADILAVSDMSSAKDFIAQSALPEFNKFKLESED